jgi:hypothetical protein
MRRKLWLENLLQIGYFEDQDGAAKYVLMQLPERYNLNSGLFMRPLGPQTASMSPVESTDIFSVICIFILQRKLHIAINLSPFTRHMVQANRTIRHSSVSVVSSDGLDAIGIPFWAAESILLATSSNRLWGLSN